MFRIAILALLICGSAGAAEADPEKFAEKLNEMYDRTEKSIKLVREQIIQSQAAPFLAQLYVQLAELLSDKSNTLYYLQMERQKNEGGASPDVDKAFSPVVRAQKEAIDVYKMVLKDFPTYPNRAELMYRLAVSLKSIDEIPQFIQYSNDVIRLFPKSEQAMKVRLMLGQHEFDNQFFEEAKKTLTPIENVPFPYERNLARYKVGLILIAEEKFKDALGRFEQVVNDPELKEQDNPNEISLKTKEFKTDLKREALIDSIRAYVRVFEKDPDPVGYYSKLAPTEAHFQEVIEKLAVRYIGLKKFDQAMKLLRTLSERLADTEKVVNIYHEVLLMIPIQDRIHLPFEEIRFLLERFNLWYSFMDVPGKTRTDSYWFFEKQLRDLATRSHEMSRTEKDTTKKRALLKRAEGFYLLYLGYFDKTKYVAKMALDLADVYFNLGDYFRSADYYLRVYHEQYGKTKDKKILLDNVILALQKKADYSYYEQLRMRGLLIKAIEEYAKVDPKSKNDPKLNFAALKAEFEQGFFPEVLDKCFEYMRKFKNSTKAIDAGDLILDYFNTRGEFAGLESWASRMLDLKLPHAAFNQKIATIRREARAKALDEKVKATTGFDELSQGKSYLVAALAGGDPAAANEALKQALARSRQERDINTFLEAGTLMAKQEKDGSKKGAILKSIAREYRRITRYKQAIDMLLQQSKDSNLPQKDRSASFDEAVNATLMLRDWNTLERLINDSQFAATSAATKSRLREQLSDLLTSAAPMAPGLQDGLLKLGMSDDLLLAMFKAQNKLQGNTQAVLAREMKARCGRESKQPLCRWTHLSSVPAVVEKFKSFLNQSPKNLSGIEKAAQQFTVVSTTLQGMEGGGDALYETAISLHNYEAFQSFANYLAACAKANPDLRPVLGPKSQETANAAKLYLDRCRAIGQKSASIGSGTKFCASKKPPTLKSLLTLKTMDVSKSPTSDPTDGEITGLQKSIFAMKTQEQSTLDLAKAYYDQGHLHHAAATASFGLAGLKENSGAYHAILGCAVMKMGLWDEANYHFKSADDFSGLKTQCSRDLQNLRGSAP